MNKPIPQICVISSKWLRINFIKCNFLLPSLGKLLKMVGTRTFSFLFQNAVRCSDECPLCVQRNTQKIETSIENHRPCCGAHSELIYLQYISSSQKLGIILEEILQEPEDKGVCCETVNCSIVICYTHKGLPTYFRKRELKKNTNRTAKVN